MAKKIEHTRESIYESLQDILRDCDQQKNLVLARYKNRNTKYDNSEVTLDFEDFMELDKVNNESMKLLSQLIDKKLEVTKIQAKVLKELGNADIETEEGKTETTGKLPINSDVLNQIKEAVTNKENKTYDLKDR